MTIMGYVILIFIAGIAGGIGQSIAGYTKGGCIAAVIIGFIGAYVGPMIADKLNLPYAFIIHLDGKSFPLLWAIVGALLFSLVLGLVMRMFDRK